VIKFTYELQAMKQLEINTAVVVLRRAIWLGLLIAVVAVPSWGQNRQNPTSQAPPAPVPGPTATGPAGNILVDPNEDYRLAAGDTIDVFVEDATELSQTYRIMAAGTIDMPFLGAIKVQGKTTQELTRYIADTLREQDYLKKPAVRVTVKQYSGQIFFIQGAVRSPGLYQLEGRPSLLKLISLAGGLQENYGPHALILRPVKKAVGQSASISVGSGTAQEDTQDNDEYELVKVALTPIIQDGNFDKNVRLEPGDIVNIPPTKVFYVAGEVVAPGSFQLKEGTTLRQAISLAQGTTFKAALNRGVIFRDEPGTGKRQEIPVDVAAVMNGKKDDITIFPNDVIIVPNSRMKSVSSTLLNAFGVNAARLPIR
jgi:polysaccharide biosynthesis/export protein